MAIGLGGKGFYVKTKEQLQPTLLKALQEVKNGFLTVVNVVIDPYGARKP